MPSEECETPIALFRNRPSLAVELLRDALHLPVPEYREVRTAAALAEHPADTVVVLSDGEPVLAIMVEVRRDRDPAGRWTWPARLACLRARLRCPAVLLVVCDRTGTAAWYDRPIDTGHPGWALRPLVAGPDTVPVMTDPLQAIAAPELAVLSALAHGDSPVGRSVLDAMYAACTALDEHGDGWGRIYVDSVLGRLTGAGARHHLESLAMGGFAEDGNGIPDKYVAEGKAAAVLAVLAAREVEIPDEVRTRVSACTDPAVLDTWVRRAVSVHLAEELFA